MSDERLVLDVGLGNRLAQHDALYRIGQERTYAGHPGSMAAALPGPTGADCIVLARSADGEPQAGMQLHVRRPDEPLPVEVALGDLCAIGEAIARAPDPLIQLCGTWVVPAFSETGLAVAVVAATLAAGRWLGARRIVGYTHQHALPLYRRFGAEVDAELGTHPYPDERYQTSVIWSDPQDCGEEQGTVDAFTDLLTRGETLCFDPAGPIP